ncbi:MAG: choice-of-anchor B family protein [Flavobacteriales bacterium]|nr:choice-of-anchor B family protein [Flavobacteriales bacterium]
MKNTLLFLLLVASTASFAQGSLNMDSLFNWQDVSLVPSAAHSNTYNEIWGYAKNGKEYAIIGSTAGTHIFDVTNPATSHQVALVPGAVTGSQVVHRDFHDYDDYLYMVCDEGPSTLQIIDLRFLPDSAPVVYDSDALFNRCHNIFIDTSSARMYMCGGSKLFAVYSLADPTAPTLLLDCPNDVPFWSSIGYVHDVYVRNDTAYCNAGWNGLFVVDFSNIAEPQMIGSLDTYVQSGYNHSGWLMPDAPFYALADETHGMDIKIVDVSDMNNLEVTDTIGSNVNTNSIPHNLIYNNGFLYVSYYFDGVYMFDCSNPAHPTLAGFYDTSTELHQHGWYRGCWGVYPFLPSGNILASDMQTGLWVFKNNLVASIIEGGEEASAFSVYPNPVSERLFLSEQFANASFSIVDMTGKVASTGTTSNSLDVSQLPSGLFTVLIWDDGKEFSKRFLKL